MIDTRLSDVYAIVGGVSDAAASPNLRGFHFQGFRSRSNIPNRRLRSGSAPTRSIGR